MSERTRTAGILALILALTAYAYAPLLVAGFLGDDYRVLLSVDEAAQSGQVEGLYDVQGVRGRPGAALSLLGSRRLWTEDGRWTGAEALGLRLEHLALLLLAAWGIHGVLRRALTPWMGLTPPRPLRTPRLRCCSCTHWRQPRWDDSDRVATSWSWPWARGRRACSSPVVR